MLDLRKLVTARQSEMPGRFCIGLDPDRDKTPDCVWGPTAGIRAAVHMMGIVDTTADFAAVFKPQRAHWEALPDGEAALRTVIAHIHTNHPGIPVFLDCKRGDIDRTQAMYARAHFVLDEADGMNFNPYMGSDCLKQLIVADLSGGSSLITLGRTSNPAAWQIQDAMLANGQRVWEYNLSCALGWAKAMNVLHRFGVVMGAAHDASLLEQYKGTIAEQIPGEDAIFNQHLFKAREIVGDEALFLIPGIGKQGGHTEATIRAAWRGPGTVIINQSSGMSQASMGRDYKDAARAAAEKQCAANDAAIRLVA